MEREDKYEIKEEQESESSKMDLLASLLRQSGGVTAVGIPVGRSKPSGGRYNYTVKVKAGCCEATDTIRRNMSMTTEEYVEMMDELRDVIDRYDSEHSVRLGRKRD